MFNNLIESSSHAQEYKRRGSFLLFTTATYAVLLLLGAVASIYAYDAHLDAQSTELTIDFFPLTTEQQPPRVVSDPVRPASNPRNTPSVPIRTELIDSVTNPNNVPDRPGTIASPVPPAPANAILGDRNVNPPAPPGGRVATGTGSTPVPIAEIPPPPPPPTPPPTPTPVKVLKISQVLNSKAISLPRPNYPPIAKQTRTQGTVTVQVLIDETGKVISAKTVSGHPLLAHEAQKAAMQARFSPTIIGEQPVKVSGVITYNFIMQ